MAKNSASEVPGRALSRRLSARDMGFDKEAILKLVLTDTNSEHFLYRVFGTANALKPYKSREKNEDGEIMTGFGLLGQFEGQSADGIVANGSVLYLPGYVQDMAVAALSMPDTSAIRVAYDIYARYDKAAATSYVFNVRDLINATLEGVEEVKSEIAALPMPAKTLALPSE